LRFGPGGRGGRAAPAGVRDETGRMRELDELDGTLAEGLRERVMTDDSGMAFRIAEGEGTTRSG